MRITRGLAATAAIAALALTGCTADDAATQEESSAAPQAVATPTKIKHPDDDKSCTISIERGAYEGEAPDRAKIECGSTTREVAGDFADKTTNNYAPDSGVGTINVVGGEVRAWLYTGDGDNTCLVIYSEGDAPVSCRPTNTQGDSSPEPSDGNTVTPEASEAPRA